MKVNYQPTANLKWFQADDNYSGEPAGISPGKYRERDKLFILKQLWVSPIKGEEPIWLEIEIDEP